MLYVLKRGQYLLRHIRRGGVAIALELEDEASLSLDVNPAERHVLLREREVSLEDRPVHALSTLRNRGRLQTIATTTSRPAIG